MQTLTFDCNLDSSRHLVLNLPTSVPLGRHRVAVVIDPPEAEIATASMTPRIVEEPARAELWKNLLALREQGIEEGMHLMNWDDVNSAVRENRGGVSDE